MSEFPLVCVESVATLAGGDAAAFRGICAALPEWRRRKCEAFRFDADRRRSAAAWLLARRMFARLGVDADRLTIVESATGKPELAPPARYHFSLSHAGELVMAAIAERPIGCDVERVRPLTPGMIELAMTAGEARVLAAAAEGEAREREFCRLWTRKESVLKALGCGFERDPRTVEVLEARTEEFAALQDFTLDRRDYCAAYCVL